MAKVERRHRRMVVDLFTLAPVLESPLSRWSRGEPARTGFERDVQYPQWSEMAERCARIEAQAERRGWRRCHSQMVWQAMVAVLAFVAVAKVPDGHWYGEHPYRTAGWF